MNIPTVNLLQVGVIHTCEICRQVFKPRSILQKSCGSKQCQKDLHNLARRKRMQQGEFSSTRYRTCESCSVKYEAKNRDTNSRTCKDCSTEKLRYKPKVTKNCLWCNKEFITSRPSQEKYCPKQTQLKPKERCSYKHFEFTRPRQMREPKTCSVCNDIYYSKSYASTICKKLECRLTRERSYEKNKTNYKYPSWTELQGWIYCLYNKEFNIYKVGITSDPQERIHRYELEGFTFKSIHKFKNKREASQAEKEFYYLAESLGISPSKSDTDVTHFFKRYMRSGCTEIIWGDMISYRSLNRMLRQLSLS